ncbi:hypothetical protein A3D06_02060 [Candidatus Roizmanbacteria bacterium RIFCSPHIGHO2_02_FULL_40_9]|uniref:Type II secretion system protein GspG C-terminal domain-containing protein n=1 Tax=Candidatus Roizmanbacteria bacterium RIFCSPHIGHO2_02_FULL_40_9 TaxID=1802042 RepID=A0A1F7HC93_9BACT|nr:MAG: hypothetical protein A3D06_02060 [Candidatus Roizmanbacteria bacterium RIFCSPHIGHO2_02_FULL_40_9]
MLTNDRKGFTLIELLIVVAVIIVLVVIALMLINPTRQRQRLYDVQRKRDLTRLKVLYEDFYLNRQEYPRGEDICYDDPVNNGGVCSCHLCGLVKNASVFAPLVHVLYCDPEHPVREYLYEYDCSSGTSIAPQWYRIYAQLTGSNSCSFGVTNQPDYTLEPYPNSCENPGGTGGSGGEGNPEATPTPGSGGGGDGGGGGSPTDTPSPTSPAPTLPACPNDPTPKYCILGGVCNICGSFGNCLQSSSCDQPAQLYSNSVCTNACQAGQSGPTSTPPPTPTTFPWGDCPLDPTPKYCVTGSTCNNCGGFNNCMSQGVCNSPLQLYGNDTCNGLCYEE